MLDKLIIFGCGLLTAGAIQVLLEIVEWCLGRPIWRPLYWTAYLAIAVTALLVAFNITAPRRLSQRERLRFQNSLTDGPDLSPYVWVITYPDCFECRAYAWDFAEAMNDIGTWKNRRIGVLVYTEQLSVDWQGLYLLVNDERHLNDNEKAFADALKSARLHYSLKHNPSGEKVMLLVAPNPL